VESAKIVIEDYLYELRTVRGLSLSAGDIDRILDAIIELAKQRDHLT
jgi:hypothetical protein